MTQTSVLEDVIQAAGSAVASIFGTQEPWFPRATVWSGELALILWRGSSWLALPLGPLRGVLGWFMMRKTRLEFVRMPVMQKVLFGVVGIGASLFAGSFLERKK